MVRLIIRTRDGRQTVAELTNRPLILGRAEGCDIVLRNDGEVSREHAQVWLDEQGRVLVSDTNSKNGTRVDDGEVFRNQVRPAFRSIRIGEHEILIEGAPTPCSDGRTTVTFQADPPDRLRHTDFFPSSRGLDFNRQRLTLLMRLTERIGGAFERKALLEQALDACCEALNFERGLIVLKTPRGEPELPVSRNVERDETGAYKVSRTLVNRALLHGERAVVNDPAADLVGKLTDSLVRFPIRSALCVPIIYRDEILGAIYGDRISPGARYEPADVDFLAAIAQQVGVGLANLRLLKQYVEAQTLYAGLEAARKIQRDLLPAAPLQLHSLTIDGYNEPSAAVGGDYFDYCELPGGKVGFVIADVTGHGLAAALVMANFHGAVHAALGTEAPLPELAARVNRLVWRNTAPSVFITAVLGTVDVRTGTVQYVSAGHPGPIFVGTSAPPPDDEHNSLPLGISPDETFVVRTIERHGHAGTLLFYTDGLTECPGPDGSFLGLDRIRRALAEVERPSTESALRTALSVVRSHLGDGHSPDDVTLLAIHHTTDNFATQARSS